MIVGVSLSPGGLLLPYHVGVLDALEYNGFLTHETPVAGASAGAIATASHAAKVKSSLVLESTIEISDRCHSMGGARGRLLPLLQEKMTALLKEEEFDHFQNRPGVAGIAYREVFPYNRAILQSEFTDHTDLIQAVCHSSMFPFFTSNWPLRLDTSQKWPRFVVDGFFAVPRDRFGCPDFAMAGIAVDRTITVTPFPKEAIGLDCSTREDCIAPADNGQMGNLLRIATQSTSRQELTNVYESGWSDAEDWLRGERERSKQQANKKEQETGMEMPLSSSSSYALN